MSERSFPGFKIVQFAKAPRLHHVKTRMQPHLSAEECVALHQALTEHAFRLVGDAKLCDHELWVGSDPEHDFFTSLLVETGSEIHVQQGGDLGERMAHAVATQFEQKPTLQGALVIGSDCPFLSKPYLQQAIEALAAGSDCVIGPALDGGYVLIGFSSPQPGVFDNIVWGSDQVFTETMKRVRALKLNCTELPPLGDIDEVGDLQQLRQLFVEQGSGDNREPEHRQLLKEFAYQARLA